MMPMTIVDGVEDDGKASEYRQMTNCGSKTQR
jgi:hypothetical protein